jgi:hypothetical protein
MPTRKSANEIMRLQSEISNEIARDGPEIATMVFGEAKDQPDVVTVQNERLDDVYRQAYQRNDRTWLQGEARRNPEQFLKVAQRIGVQKPAPLAPGMQPPPAPGAFAKAAATAPPALPPPASAPVMPPAVAPTPVVVPQGPPMAPPPVILGPNGQPLPPSGAF